jgi:hypothetical protein
MITVRFATSVSPEVKRGGKDFSQEVARVLTDSRTWKGYRFISLDNGKSPSPKFREMKDLVFKLRLSTPEEVQALKGCSAFLSCADGDTMTVLVNSNRWIYGAKASKLELSQYREYLINHEVGHLILFSKGEFGKHHFTGNCKLGEKAPIMMQQTKGIKSCSPNSWPLPYELELAVKRSRKSLKSLE